MLPVPCYTPQLDARSDQKTLIFLLLQLCVITFTIGGIDRRGGGGNKVVRTREGADGDRKRRRGTEENLEGTDIKKVE